MTAQEGQPAAPALAAPRRRAMRWATATLGVLAICAGAWFLPWDAQVRFEQGVELLSASVSEQASRSQPLSVRLRFHASGPLDRDALVFVHVLGASAACNAGSDTTPVPATSRWQAGQDYLHGVQLRLPVGCEPGRVDVLAGLYFPSTGRRLALLSSAGTDDRVRVGSAQVVAADASDGMATLSGADFARQAVLAPIRPWFSWLLGIALSSLLALFARGQVSAETTSAPSATQSGAGRAPLRQLRLALPAIPFLIAMAMVLEFIKDDAYISFRYAHNLVSGKGLVFNQDERLEGITNFLWTLLLAPFEALGLDLFQVCEVLGAALGIACLVVVARLTSFVREGESKLGSELWGAFWLASSSSFVLYANSGLEQPLAALLPCAGALVLYRARARQQSQPSARNERDYLIAGLLLGAGCLTRPELHLSAVLVALPALVDVIRARRLTRAELSLSLGVLGLTAPAHLFRYLYYGSLIPNTFYVKTSSDSGVLETGLNTLRDMFAFNHTGLLLVLAPLAFLDRRRLLEKLSCLALAVSFLVYYARVGVDEMSWHRLYIPALPFACVLAAAGMQNLLDWLSARLRVPAPGRIAFAALAWIGLSFWVYDDLMVTHDAYQGFNGHGDLAGTYHPDMGKFLVRHERPGALVAFQDMGSTPYYAPDLSFLDFFGLVDETVAHARHDHGLHPFIVGDPVAQREFDREMRAYFFARNPEWTILTIYTNGRDQSRVTQAFEKDPTGGAFGGFYRNNGVQFGLWDDPRFQQRYVPVRTWPRSTAYYLALWRRRDLWQQTPREVVLDAPPAQAESMRTRFDGGLELLGAELTGEAPERHEAFVTTWWRLPGPMARDLTFFIHFVRADGRSQIPADHVPGDWMYPADRWQAGQILEDRCLFQLPPETMPVGAYRVYIGAYRRESGERLRITAGESDGDNRVLLGTLNVRPLRPLVDALIPRTDVSTMRAHEERIVGARAEVAGVAR